MARKVSGVSIVIPCKNESGCVGQTVERIKRTLDPCEFDYEVIVVDDGSSDRSGLEALEAGARVLVHPVNRGYGVSLVDGLKAASYPLVGILDADGTYPIEDLPRLIRDAATSDLVIGTRIWNKENTSGFARMFRRALYYLILYLSNVRAPDYNSGFRVFWRDETLAFRPFLCPTFSFTTSQTLLYLLNGKIVSFRPIKYGERIGKSHVQYWRDSMRTLRYVFLITNAFQIYRLSLIFTLLMILGNGAVMLFSYLLGMGAAHQIGLHFAISAAPIMCLITMGVQLIGGWRSPASGADNGITAEAEANPESNVKELIPYANLGSAFGT